MITKKRFLSMMLCLVMFTTMLIGNTTVAFAATGTDINGVTWNYTVTGPTTARIEYSSATVSGNVTVPTTIDGYDVTELASNFLSTATITSLTIPGTIKDFPFAGASNCPNLQSVTLEEGVETIGQFAFADSYAVNSVSLPNSLTTIGGNAFKNNDALVEITIPGNDIALGTGIFEGCNLLQSATLEEGMTSVGNSMFSECINLTTVSLPSTLTLIEFYGFYGCWNITEITIPEGVANVIYGAFEECSSLSKMTFDGDYPNIESGAIPATTTIQYYYDKTGWPLSGTTLNISGTDYTAYPIYTITYDSKGGSAVAAEEVLYGTTIPEPSDPSYPGYAFGGWYSDAGLTNLWDFATTVTDSGISLTAKWDIPVYTIDFNVNGGSAVTPQAITSGSIVTEPSDPTKPGCTLEGWYSNPGLTTLWDFALDTVTGDTTIYAKWDSVIYPVTFNSNGGTAITPQAITYGALVAEPTNPTRTSFTFGGWFSDAGLTTPWDFTTDTVSDNTTLYAKWTAVIIPPSGGGGGGGSKPVTPPVVVPPVVPPAVVHKTMNVPAELQHENHAQIVATYIGKDGLKHIIVGGHYNKETNVFVYPYDESLKDVEIILELVPVTFKHVPKNHWAYDALASLSARGVIVDPNIDADAATSRADLVKMLAKASNIDLSKYKDQSNPFKDVSPDSEYNAFIKWAYEKDIVTGYDENTFKPDNKITRQEMSAMIIRFINETGFESKTSSVNIAYEDEKAIESWAKTYVGKLTSYGLIKGVDKDGTIQFLPNNDITNAEISTIIMRIFENSK